MASESSPPTSFSASRRWGIFFSVIISIVAMCALVIMLNYLGARYFQRVYWSTQTNDQLSPQTLSLLKSITNQVKVIVYYDKDDDLYTPVTSLLEEYHLANPKISVQKVDYLVDAGAAGKIKNDYNLGGGETTNLVIFDCEGRHKVIYSSQLEHYELENKSVTSDGRMEMEKHLTAFNGEKWFSAALLNIVNSKQFKAYFLQGDGEPEVGEPSGSGYLKFAQVLDQNNVATSVLRLIGTNVIPDDCNLLIIAGPRVALQPEELEKIRHYLNQGRRMFVLFNYRTLNSATGLESILADWNVSVGFNQIDDPENTLPDGSLSIFYFDPRSPTHPVVAPLLGLTLKMLHPRSIAVSTHGKTGPEAPNVRELAFTGPHSTVSYGGNTPAKPVGNAPIMAAVEKGSIKGVLQERGSTAILVAGDSEFLDNDQIDAVANHDFAGFAVNWLVDQTELLQGIGAHPVKEYKLMMTEAQLRSVQWIFLGAMPGGILAFGVLVWFRRRH